MITMGMSLYTNNIEGGNMIDIPELLNTATTSEIDEVFDFLSKNIYSFEGKKATYRLVGIMKEEGFIFHFVDNVLEVDTFTVKTDDLPLLLRADIIGILKLIR